MGDLLPPRQLVAAKAVRKHDRRLRARDLVMDAVRAALKAADAADGQGRMDGHERRDGMRNANLASLADPVTGLHREPGCTPGRRRYPPPTSPPTQGMLKPAKPEKTAAENATGKRAPHRNG